MFKVFYLCLVVVDKKIILFDGVCNLCNNAIQFIIKHDKKDLFRFATLQGETGKKLITERNINTSKIDSIILIEPNIAYYIKSTAALKIGRNFGGVWIFLWVLEQIPVGFRDWVYSYIAKNRYNWFGKKDNCMIPTPELKAKFLD
ncbi:putative DCC family thiol-disulfide oxidoreductase YuxK [Cellulophaga sp. RHA19]|nr:putative DCC family thiol-disulfide oxidoreductase YuxK [Cellulophaga sp. RHA19]